MAIGTSDKITFMNKQGQKLAARLDSPPTRPIAYALFTHCFTCSKDIFAAARIAEGLVANNIAVLRFDFTGLGSSEGEFANSNFSSNVADLIAAADFLGKNHQAPQILVGHSLGGAAVLAAAKEIHSAKAVATINAPADPDHVKENFIHAVPEIEERGLAQVILGGQEFTIQKQFLEDIAAARLCETIATMHKALLVFHGPLDERVSIENAAAIFQAAKHPKSFISLDQADHLLSRRDDAAYVADILGAWARRFIEIPAADTGTRQEGSVYVAEDGWGKFAQNIRVGKAHELRADEPVKIGGGNSGPTPYDLLLAGLGACTTMTVRMYAERKGIPLDRASVSLRHEKIHAEDCQSCETEAGKVDRIERELRLEGDLTENQRLKLLEIADKCPVHRTLHSEVSIDTRLAGE